MTTKKWNQSYGIPQPITKLTVEQDLKLRLIKDSIENTIRKALPVKEILKQQLDIYDNENKNKVTTDDIRKMLLEEIKSLKGESTKEEEIQEDDKEEESDEDKVDGEMLRERINNIDEKFKMDLINDTTENEVIPVPQEENVTEIIEETEKNNYYESPDGYVSPDEEEIKSKCEDLNINTIPDIGVSEENYDNVDIYSDTKENNIGDKSLLESYLDDDVEIVEVELKTGYKRSTSPLKSSLKLKSDVLYTFPSLLDPNVFPLK